MDNYDGPYFCNPETWEAAKRVLYAIMDKPGEPIVRPARSAPRDNDPSTDTCMDLKRRLREDMCSAAILPGEP